MYEKRCREKMEEQEKETKLPKGLKWNKQKKSLEQIDLDLKAKMEYEQRITLGISRSVGTNIVHSFLWPLSPNNKYGCRLYRLYWSYRS